MHGTKEDAERLARAVARAEGRRVRICTDRDHPADLLVGYDDDPNTDRQMKERRRWQIVAVCHPSGVIS